MAIATMPSSCELRDVTGKSWAVQIKPAGAGPEEYIFVPGLSSAAVNEATTSVDATTIDMGDYTTEAKVSKALTVTLSGFYKQVGGMPVYAPAQKMLKASSGEIGEYGSIDMRIWRTDVEDEGWEATWSGSWEDSGNEPGALRGFTATMSPTCEPTKIMSVLEEGITAESVPVDMDDYLAILRPAGAPVDGGDGSGG